MSFNAPLVSAGLGLAGLGFNSYIQRKAAKYAKPSPAAVVPVNKQYIQDMQIAQLRKAVLRNKPWVENTKITKSFNVIGTTVGVTNYSLTSELLANSEFSYKTIGDVIRNFKINYRSYSDSLAFNTVQVATMRIVFYIPKDPGVYLSSTTLYDQAIIDPATFTVLSDRTYYPATSTDFKFPRGSVNLKGRLTKIDRTGVTSGTIRSGEICVAIMTRATSVSVPQAGVYFEWQMFYSNK